MCYKLASWDWNDKIFQTFLAISIEAGWIDSGGSRGVSKVSIETPFSDLLASHKLLELRSPYSWLLEIQLIQHYRIKRAWLKWVRQSLKPPF